MTAGLQGQGDAGIFALIIAIDGYLKDSIRPLQGCVRDGEDFHEYLRTTLSVPQGNILTLYNQHATRENILTAISNHLIYNKKIVPGNLIFFFYAGHGDSVRGEPGYNNNDREVETICPYDITVFEAKSSDRASAHVAEHGGSGPTYGIPDRTFNALMRVLAKAKGNNIVAIFDCCHSGGMSREGPNASVLGSRALRDSGALQGLPMLPIDLDKDVYNRFKDITEQDDSDTRAVSLVTPAGFAYSATKSHVLLAACQPGEKAREGIAVDGHHRGRFTYHLLKYLRAGGIENTPNITYNALTEAVSQRMAAPHAGAPLDCALTAVQRPHCEGRYKQRRLFSLEEEVSFPLRYALCDPRKTMQALYVAAGSAQGINENSKFTCRYSRHPSVPSSKSKAATSEVVLLPLHTEAVEAERTKVTVASEFPGYLSVAELEGRSPDSPPVMATISAWGANVRALESDLQEILRELGLRELRRETHPFPYRRIDA